MVVRKSENEHEEVLGRVVASDGVSLLDALTNRSREQRHAAVRAFMETEPFPHYEGGPDRRDLLVRIEADGSRSVGRFVNQQWRPVGRK